MSIPRLRLAALCAALGLAGCQSAPSAPPKGPCEPTVEGSNAGRYPEFEGARRAFTRTTKDNSLTATLEDVAWLRFEGDEQTIVSKHRAYFEQGYTTFAMTSFTKEFVQPTAEVFVLTDSAGARATARPGAYQSSMAQENERYAARFTVSFRHAITRDLAWVRLTRQNDGSTLEWVFPGGGGAPVAMVPEVAAPEGAVPPPLQFETTRTTKTAPLDPLARPVNLLTHPEAGPPIRSEVPPPAVPPPADALPPLGVPPSGPLPPPETRRLPR